VGDLMRDGTSRLVAGAAVLALACAAHTAAPGGGDGPVDHPPAISQLATSSTSATVGAAVSLTVTASDPDGQAIAYGWAAAPSGCGAFSVVDAASTVLTGAAVGLCTVTATVSAGGLSASRSVALTFAAPGDHPPVITALTASRTTALVGDTVSLSATASDPDADPLAFAWTVAPGGCGTYSVTDAATTVLTGAAAGTCTAAVTVTARGVPVSRSMPLTFVTSLPAAPAAMPRVAYSYTVMSANGATTPAAAVSGLGQAVVIWSRGGDTAPWDGNVQDGYDARLSDASLGGPIDNAFSNGPVDYVIEASSNGGTTWTTLLTVTGNTYIVRGHLIDLTGYTSVRMRLTSAPRHPAGVYGTDFAVHDARSGHDDWWLFLGDSITTNVFNVYDGGRTGSGGLKYGWNIHARQASRWPVAHEGGISQGRIADLLWTGWQGTDGRPLLAKWLEDFPGKYVSLGIGTNDVNGGLSQIDAMDANFRSLVALVLAAGKTPVIPSLRWNSVGGSFMPTWHARLAAIVADHPAAIAGPDLYTRSLAQGTAGLLPDGVHCNSAGAALTQQDWASWAVGNVYLP
jgi:lysophospholipase L1-like esterase